MHNRLNSACVRRFGALVAIVGLLLFAPGTDAQQFTLKSSSFLGSDGDAVRGVRIQSDGTIVVAVNLAETAVAGTAITPLTSGATARGCILRLGGDGRKILAAVRVAETISDVAVDGRDGIYIAGGASGLVKLSPQADRIERTRDIGAACTRVDASPDGYCVAVASGKGVVLIDPDGKELARGLARMNTSDVCIDGSSRTIVTVGFRNAHAHDGRRTEPVQICYALGIGYDGMQKWCNYDWSTDQASDRFINKPTNNMADTRGYRCVIGRDGSLYCGFEAAGGNHIFRCSPSNIMAKLKLVGGDQYFQFHASAAEHKSVLVKFDPATGQFIQGQQFCPRRDNGRAGNSRVKDGDIATDEEGRLLLAGYGDANLPLSLDPCPPGESKGGGFLLALSPDFAKRLLCIRLQGGGGSAHCVDARRIGDRLVVVYGGSGAKTEMHTLHPLQAEVSGAVGFVVIIEGQYRHLPRHVP